jgi:hypothetical protein
VKGAGVGEPEEIGDLLDPQGGILEIFLGHLGPAGVQQLAEASPFLLQLQLEDPDADPEIPGHREGVGSDAARAPGDGFEDLDAVVPLFGLLRKGFLQGCLQ